MGAVAVAVAGTGVQRLQPRAAEDTAAEVDVVAAHAGVEHVRRDAGAGRDVLVRARQRPEAAGRCGRAPRSRPLHRGEVRRPGIVGSASARRDEAIRLDGGDPGLRRAARSSCAGVAATTATGEHLRRTCRTRCRRVAHELLRRRRVGARRRSGRCRSRRRHHRRRVDSVRCSPRGRWRRWRPDATVGPPPRPPPCAVTANSGEADASATQSGPVSVMRGIITPRPRQQREWRPPSCGPFDRRAGPDLVY